VRRWFFIWLGFSATAAQLVLTRELLVVAEGNEICLGLVLAAWMLSTGAGSFILGRFAVFASRLWISIGLVGVGLTFLTGILAIRSIRWLAGITPGETLDIGSLVWVALLSLGPVCFLSGSLFALGGRFLAAEASVPPAHAVSRVYAFEALGAAGGGLVAASLLLPFLSPFQIASLVGVVHIWFATALLFGFSRGRRTVFASLILLACSIGLVWGPASWLEQWSLVRFWNGWSIRQVRNSPYGNLVLAGRDGSSTTFFNGIPVFTVPDKQAAEEAVHNALLQHPAPRAVLLVGSTGPGSLLEALRHPAVTRLDFVELDPVLLALTEEAFAGEWGRLKADRRFAVHQADPRDFIRHWRGAQKYDVIVLNLPDPRTAQVNRFYTVEFFHEVNRRLNPGGVLGFRLTGSENYVGEELADSLRCVWTTARLVFPDVKAFPGSVVHFFASKTEGALSDKPEVLLKRLSDRGIGTAYVDTSHLPFRLMPDRVDEFRALLSERTAPPNRDFEPIGYFKAMVAWTSLFDPGVRDFLARLGELEFARVLLGAVGVVSLICAFIGLAPVSRRKPIALGAASTAMGMLLMGLQVFLFLGFQVVHGAVYYHMSVLVAAFMLGMGTGSLIASDTKVSMQRLVFVQLAGTLWPVVFCLLLPVVPSLSSPRLLYLFFPLTSLMTGLLGGFHFPYVNRLYLTPGKERNTGLLYAIDLSGASLGALAIGAWLVPVYGFLRTSAVLAIIGAGPLLMLAGRFGWEKTLSTNTTKGHE